MEELLAIRRLLLSQISDTRSLFMPETTAHYPTIHRCLQHLRSTFTLGCLQENLWRGIREGYYRADLEVEKQAHEWLRQADAVMGETRSAAELTDAHQMQLTRFLGGIATPLGAFVVQRLQEMPSYY